MILSHRHGFIFVKTRKTAGTSVELSLRRYCGPADVITPLLPADETLAADGPGPQRHDRPARFYEVRLRKADLAAFARGRWPRRRIFSEHMTASELRAAVEDDTWNRFYKFCVARNPWDAAVSRLFWERYRRRDSSLTMDWLLGRWDPSRNWQQYTIDGEVAVDEVLDYARLLEGVARSCDTVGIRFDGWLPRAKSGTGRGSVHYRDVLEPRHVDRIADACTREIEYMGYQF